VYDAFLSHIYPEYQRAVAPHEIRRLYVQIVPQTIIQRTPADNLPTVSLALRTLFPMKVDENTIDGFCCCVLKLAEDQPLIATGCSFLAAHMLLRHRTPKGESKTPKQHSHTTSVLSDLVRDLYHNYHVSGALGNPPIEITVDIEPHQLYEPIMARYNLGALKNRSVGHSIAVILTALYMGSCKDRAKHLSSGSPLTKELGRAISILKNVSPNLKLVARRGHDAREEHALIEDQFNFQLCAIPPRSCYWVSIRLKAPPTRTEIKSLRYLFPPTSATDKKHMSTQVDAIIWQFIVGARCFEKIRPEVGAQSTPEFRAQIVSRTISQLPIGSNAVLVTCLMINSLQTSNPTIVERTFLESQVLCRSLRGQQSVCKAISTYIRKTGCYVDQDPISSEEVCSLTYLDLAFGRSLNVSDWEQEKRNRCETIHHIRATTTHYR